LKNRIVPNWLIQFLLVVLLLSIASSAFGEDQPTIAKDSIHVTAYTMNSYKKSFDTWSWVPSIAFRVNGPIASGSQFYAEFTRPDSASWVKFDCKTEQIQKGHSLKTEGGGHDISEDKGCLYTGPVNFAIKMRNELAGGDATLFTGHIKVVKAHSNEGGTKVANHFVYYVDQDWNLPIGYAFSSGEKTSPQFNVAFWVRGDADTASFQPHLYCQGKEVGKAFFEGNEVCKAGAKPELVLEPTHFVADSVPQRAKWARVVCNFPNVREFDKSGNKSAAPWGPPYMLNANPGEYECKVLWHNHLARSMKITVDADGKFDNGIGTNNNLASKRIIVPVQIIGDQDGKWDRGAWKTDAFYGNPLTGFEAIP
jgi:hypothetical protein